MAILFGLFSLSKRLGVSTDLAAAAFCLAATAWVVWLYGGFRHRRSRWPRDRKTRKAIKERPPWKLVAALFATVFIVSLGFLQWRSQAEAEQAVSPLTLPMKGSETGEANQFASPQHVNRTERTPPPASADARRSTTTNSIPLFGLCHTGGGQNCVVDGDTFWMNGVKIRIADIDAPETHPPHCPYEADLGNRATVRLHELLNAGPIELEPIQSRDEDRYDRKLRIVVRNGQSIGDQLVGEGLARTWTGRREPWC